MMIGGMGKKYGAQDAADPEDASEGAEPTEPGADDQLMAMAGKKAAKSFLAAIESGDAGAVYKAFQALKDSCE